MYFIAEFSSDRLTPRRLEIDNLPENI